jgi:hypothetical protein
LKRNELILRLVAHGLFNGRWTLDDDLYSTVSTAFILDAHVEWMRGLPPELRIMHDIGGGKTEAAAKWVVESWDCENIGKDFGTYLSRCMAVDAVVTGRPHGNIAAGTFNFHPTPDTAHAVNWFFDHEERAHHFDSGDGHLDHLTPQQLATIYSGESI